MNAFQKKIGRRVLGIHAAIVLFLVVGSLMRGCFRPKPREIATFIEFGEPAPQVEVVPVSQMAEPEPPAPEPKPAPIPEPVKPKPKPKPVPKPSPKEPAKPKKPKWKPTKVDPSKSKRIEAPPQKPTISEADIKKALSGIAHRPAGTPDQINAYIGSIGRFFYKYWNPPASASSASGVAIVRISIRKNGQITKRVKIQGSGDALYDRTAMDAVNAVGKIPRPPPSYPYDYVEVEFRLENR